MRLFHATKIENVPSILKHGLKSRCEGVYLSDSIKGAARWKVLTMQEKTIAVIEVEIDRHTIRDGVDHSPLMQAKFGAGKSFLSPKSIPGKSVKRIHFCTIEKRANPQVATRKNRSV